MPPFEKHVFICTNRRDPSNPKGSCAHSGSEAICDAFKSEVASAGRSEARLSRWGSAGQVDQVQAADKVGMDSDELIVTPEAILVRTRRG